MTTSDDGRATPAIGFFLSCEEYPPEVLVAQARAAEQAGFDGLWISDHFHPWNDEQGQSPFVWSIIGAIAQVCELPVTTAVTCPTVRQHPALVAQAAATCARMLDNRFILGVGTGEALNEHVYGDGWPGFDVRLEMLEEAVDLIRQLWGGEVVSHRGRHYTVEQARIYTLPDRPPPIYMSGFGPKATRAAAFLADGYISTRADPELLDLFRRESGGKPAHAGTKVAWAPSKDEGVGHAHRLWAVAGLPGELGQVLPTPRHLEQASTLVTESMTRKTVTAGPDIADHVRNLREYVDAGYEAVHVANMGPHWRDMIEAYRSEVLPEVRRSVRAPA